MMKVITVLLCVYILPIYAGFKVSPFIMWETNDVDLNFTYTSNSRSISVNWVTTASEIDTLRIGASTIVDAGNTRYHRLVYRIPVANTRYMLAIGIVGERDTLYFNSKPANIDDYNIAIFGRLSGSKYRLGLWADSVVKYAPKSIILTGNFMGTSTLDNLIDVIPDSIPLIIDYDSQETDSLENIFISPAMTGYSAPGTWNYKYLLEPKTRSWVNEFRGKFRMAVQVGSLDIITVNSNEPVGWKSDQWGILADQMNLSISSLEMVVIPDSADIDSLENLLDLYQRKLVFGNGATYNRKQRDGITVVTLDSTHYIIGHMYYPDSVRFWVKEADGDTSDTFLLEARIFSAMPHISCNGSPDTSAVVSYKSRLSEITKVIYGTSSGIYPDTVISVGKYHRVNIYPLAANTKYYYAVLVDDRLSDEYSFTTQRTGFYTGEWKFGYTSNIQFPLGSIYNHMPVLADSIAAQDYKFFINGGDFVQSMWNQSHWQGTTYQIFSFASKYFFGGTFCNHGTETKAVIDTLSEYYDMPNDTINESIWAQDIAGIKFISIDQTEDYNYESIQFAWLDSVIKASVGKRICLLMASGWWNDYDQSLLDGGTIGLEQIRPLCENGDVALVIHGDKWATNSDKNWNRVGVTCLTIEGGRQGDWWEITVNYGGKLNYCKAEWKNLFGLTTINPVYFWWYPARIDKSILLP